MRPCADRFAAAGQEEQITATGDAANNVCGLNLACDSALLWLLSYHLPLVLRQPRNTGNMLRRTVWRQRPGGPRAVVLVFLQ